MGISLRPASLGDSKGLGGTKRLFRRFDAEARLECRQLLADVDRHVSEIARLSKAAVRECTIHSTRVGRLEKSSEIDAKSEFLGPRDHGARVGETTDAQSATTDDQLKKLIADLLPTLQKHQELAQKIVDAQGKK